eukprot:364599-Chlamydomonas_euryale.AAC.5
MGGGLQTTHAHACPLCNEHGPAADTWPQPGSRYANVRWGLELAAKSRMCTWCVAFVLLGNASRALPPLKSFVGRMQFLADDEVSKLQETFECGAEGNIFRVRPLLQDSMSAIESVKQLRVSRGRVLPERGRGNEMARRMTK